MAPDNWHQLDKTESGYNGISLGKAYQFVKGKKSQPVLVAVIDSGIDTTHEDLKSVLWHNPKEIPGNGIDDDHNGYVDDIYGWNFIGGKDGRNVKEDSYEAARVYWKLKGKYGNTVPDPSTAKTSEQKAEMELYSKVKHKVEDDVISEIDLILLKRIFSTMVKSDTVLQQAMNKKVYTGDELKEYIPVKPEVQRAKTVYLEFAEMNKSLDQTNKEFMEGFDGYLKQEQ
jgi:hypothetical protein